MGGGRKSLVVGSLSPVLRERERQRACVVLEPSRIPGLRRRGRGAAPLVLLLASACVLYSPNTTPLEAPLQRVLKEPSLFSQLPQGEQTASIGDELFVLRRYVTGAVEEVALLAPPTLAPFPVRATWSRTHVYDGDDGHQLPVFTSEAYYNGAIGVILDNEDYLATRKPMVQVAGAKRGRRWSIAGHGKFFEVPVELVEAWALRYGGRKGADFAFEIVNKPDSNVVQVIQALQISEADFLRGFTVKGVLVTGLARSEAGIIRYRVEDKRIDR